MLAALALAATLLLAQPFSVAVKVLGPDGAVHTLVVGRYAERSACEADRAALAADLAPRGYMLEIAGSPYLALASACIVRGGLAA